MTGASPESQLLSRLKSGKRLPSPPGAAMRVLQLCRNETPGINELTTVITADPALSARLLKFANSPATGLARSVNSVREAVLLMGVRSVKLAALGFCVSPGDEGACRGFDLRQYWSEAGATAVLCRCIGREGFGSDPEESFTAGLLSGIGRLALALGAPAEYAKVLDFVSPDRRLVDAEREAFGVSHAELGAELLRDWGLPELLVKAVRAVPDASAEGPAGQLARCVAVAQTLSPWFVQPRVTPEQMRTIRSTAEGVLRLDAQAWEALVAKVRAGYAGLSEVLNIELSPGVSVMDLYAEAQEEATRVGMVAQMERVKVAQDVEALRKQATTDRLTGIANRARFDERLTELVSAANHQPFALVLFDIDHFKKFNDTHGHQTGDLVLTRVARAISNSLKPGELLARYGGEEFAILAAAATRESACLIAAKANKTIASLVIPSGETRLNVTISAGVALSTDFSEAITGEEIVAQADRELYRSKAAGRNTWSYLGRTAAPAKAAAAA